MEATVGYDTSSNFFGTANTMMNRASSPDHEYQSSNTNNLFDFHPNYDSKFNSENSCNSMYRTNGLPVAEDTSPRPIISVRNTQELFGIADDAEKNMVVQDTSIEVNQIQPVVQKSILRPISSEVIAFSLNPNARSSSPAGGGPEPKQRRKIVRMPSEIKLPSSITVFKKPRESPLKSISEMLANRGVTVSSVEPQSRKSTPSVTITSQKMKSSQNDLPTVDLTKEPNNPRRAAVRAGRSSREEYLCQICDKSFTLPSELTQHMDCHRGSRPECRECTAQYPTQRDLDRHRQKYHRPPPDLAVPVVDLEQGGVLSKLFSLGVRSVIPLAQLHSGAGGGGAFGLPVVAVSAASNPALCDIGLLGASNILPIGPLQAIPFNNNK